MTRRALAAVAAQVESFFLEPREESPRHTSAVPLPLDASPPRRVVAVLGLSARCGTTTVARALAAELASRDAAGAAAVSSKARAGGLPLATPAATRLARSLNYVPRARTTAVGRLCLVEGAEASALSDTAPHFAPLVLDAGGSQIGGTEAAVADRVVLVAAPALQPALLTLAVDCARRQGGEPLVAMNRAAGPAAAGVALPEARMGAQLALGGRQARGELGRAIGALADLCEGHA